MIRFATLLAVLMIPAGAAQAKPFHFADGFESSRIGGWASPGTSTPNGDWSAPDGQLHHSGPAGSLIAGSRAWRNYTYRVQVTGGGVIFRYVNPWNFYRATFGAHPRLMGYWHGHARTVATSSQSLTGTLSVRVVTHPGSLRVYANNRRVFGFRAAHIPSGRFGVYAPGNARFDSVALDTSVPFFTLAVVPDTQNEVQNRPGMLNDQWGWMADARADQNLGLVLQEGDVVNTLSDSAQWATAETSFGYLRSKLPVVACAGNHDIQDYVHDKGPFPTHDEEFSTFRADVGQRVDGAYDALNTYASYNVGGTRFLVLSLQFGAPDSVLAWAGQVVDAHPGEETILLTHDYMDENNELRAPPDEYLPRKYNPTLNDGIDMWDKLVSRHAIRWVLNGHVVTGTAGRRTDANPGGVVHAMMFNRQNEDSGGGYLRLLRFEPGRVSVRTFSPTTGFLRDPANEFSLTR